MTPPLRGRNIIGMKLSDFLEKNSIKPSRFANQIGVPASTIMRLLDGGRPGIELMEKIAAGTCGEVMQNDFLSLRAANVAGIRYEET